MLDEMTPEEFRERFAHWMITDRSDPRRRHAELIAEIHNIVNRYLAARLGRSPRPSELLTADELILPMYRGGDADQDVDPIERIDPERLARALGC
jgi:hypothetical protein